MNPFIYASMAEERTHGDQAAFLRDFVAIHGNARQMELTDLINANTQKLLSLEPDSDEARKLRWEQAQLLTERMGMMKGEEDEQE